MQEKVLIDISLDVFDFLVACTGVCFLVELPKCAIYLREKEEISINNQLI